MLSHMLLLFLVTKLIAKVTKTENFHDIGHHSKFLLLAKVANAFWSI